MPDTDIKSPGQEQRIMNTTCNIFYSIDGVNVFLALESEMEGVEPYDTGSSDVNAYELKDYPIFVAENGEDAEPHMTYYEAYNGRYSENGAEISWRTVLNAENDNSTIKDWVLISDDDDADKALVDAGFNPVNPSYSYPCADILESEMNQEEHLNIVEVTSGINGYPSNLRQAIVGFSSFDIAKDLAEKFLKDVVLLHKRDGWNLYEIYGNNLISEPELSPEDLGYQRRWDGWTDESDLIEDFVDKIDGYNDLSVVVAIANDYKLIYKELQTLGDDEVIFAEPENGDGDRVIWEKAKEHPTSWSYDTHNYIVAII